jgi:hypothetical protein
MPNRAWLTPPAQGEADGGPCRSQHAPNPGGLVRRSAPRLGDSRTIAPVKHPRPGIIRNPHRNLGGTHPCC